MYYKMLVYFEIPVLIEIEEIRSYSFKVLVIGNVGVGKTSLSRRFSDEMFYKFYYPTIGMDFFCKHIRHDHGRVFIRLHDIAGQDRNVSLSRAFFRQADGIMICYDVTNPYSLATVKDWVKTVDENLIQLDGSKLPRILVGNKSDARRPREKNHRKKMIKFAEENDFIAWCEVSAKTGENVDECIAILTHTKNNMQEESTSQHNKEPTDENNSDASSSKDTNIISSTEEYREVLESCVSQPVTNLLPDFNMIEKRISESENSDSSYLTAIETLNDSDICVSESENSDNSYSIARETLIDEEDIYLSDNIHQDMVFKCTENIPIEGSLYDELNANQISKPVSKEQVNTNNPDSSSSEDTYITTSTEKSKERITDIALQPVRNLLPDVNVIEKDIDEHENIGSNINHSASTETLIYNESITYTRMSSLDNTDDQNMFSSENEHNVDQILTSLSKEQTDTTSVSSSSEDTCTIASTGTSGEVFVDTPLQAVRNILISENDSDYSTQTETLINKPNITQISQLNSVDDQNLLTNDSENEIPIAAVLYDEHNADQTISVSKEEREKNNSGSSFSEGTSRDGTGECASKSVRNLLLDFNLIDKNICKNEDSDSIDSSTTKKFINNMDITQISQFHNFGDQHCECDSENEISIPDADQRVISISDYSIQTKQLNTEVQTDSEQNSIIFSREGIFQMIWNPMNNSITFEEFFEIVKIETIRENEEEILKMLKKKIDRSENVWSYKIRKIKSKSTDDVPSYIDHTDGAIGGRVLNKRDTSSDKSSDNKNGIIRKTTLRSLILSPNLTMLKTSKKISQSIDLHEEDELGNLLNINTICENLKISAWFVTSAKEGTNIERAFNYLIVQMLQNKTKFYKCEPVIPVSSKRKSFLENCCIN